jgi:hypothetical protein
VGHAGGCHGKGRNPAVRNSGGYAGVGGKKRRAGQAGFRYFLSAAQHAVSTAENQAASVQAGAKEVGELAMGFAERNVTSSFEFAQRLLQAKDPKDVMALHADYVNSQIAALTEQGKELGERVAKMTGQGSKR